MDKEGAFEILNQICNEICSINMDCLDSKDGEAMKKAIEVLKQQPCEDCISRQAVLDIDFEKIILTTAKPAEMIEQKIRALPPVTPKVGRWAILKDEYGDIVDAVCSCCDEHGNHKWTFCPNCGAKMEIKEESEYGIDE